MMSILKVIFLLFGVIVFLKILAKPQINDSQTAV